MTCVRLSRVGVRLSRAGHKEQCRVLLVLSTPHSGCSQLTCCEDTQGEVHMAKKQGLLPTAIASQIGSGCSSPSQAFKWLKPEPEPPSYVASEFLILRNYEAINVCCIKTPWFVGVFFFSSKLNRQTKNSMIFNVYILVVKAICYTAINETKRKKNKSLNKVWLTLCYQNYPWKLNYTSI